MTSVNFNAAATSALRVLQNTNSQLDSTQNRISTGLKIGEAKDNAAYWSISTSMKSDNKAMSTVSDALGLGSATVDTAYQGLNAAKDVLDEIKSKLTAATQTGVDRDAVQAEISALQEQLKSIASSSVFSGENWLSTNSANGTEKSIVSSFTRDANNAISIGTIKIDTSKVALFDSAGRGILDTGKQLVGSNGQELAYGGTAASGTAPALVGLNGTTTPAPGTTQKDATHAVATLGTFNVAGLDKADRLTFDLTVDGGLVQNVSVNLASLNTTTPALAESTFLAALNGATSGGDFSLVGGKLTFTSTSVGSTASVAITNVQARDGDLDITSTLGLAGAAAQASGTNDAASLTLLGTFAKDADVANGDRLAFDLELNGVTKSFSIDAFAPADATAMASAINTAIQNATTGFGAANIEAVLVGGDLVIRSKNAGAEAGQNGDTVAVSNLRGVRAGVTNADAQWGLTTVNATGVRDTDGSQAAVYTTSVTPVFTNIKSGDTIKFDLTLDGTLRTIEFDTSSIAAATGDADRRTALLAAVQSAINNTTGINAGDVVVDYTGGNVLRFTTGDKGADAKILVGNFRSEDGNGVTTTALGLTNSTGVARGENAVLDVAAKVTTGSAFGGAVTFDDQDTMRFSISVDGKATTVKINKATIEAALAADPTYVADSGRIADADQFALVVKQALTNANINNVDVAQSTAQAGRLEFTHQTVGANHTLSIDNASFSSSTGASTISVEDIDISKEALKAYSSAQIGELLSAYTKVVNEAITQVTAAAANLGAVSSRIEMQQTFVQNLMDTIDKGVSGLVDADMNEESTKLQALQVKQQLGVQALSIANQSAQNVLSLFR